MTATDAQPGQYFAPDSVKPIDVKPNRPSDFYTIPTLAAPPPVLEAHKLHRQYRTERTALRDRADEASKRRRSALSLLVADTNDEVADVVVDHADEWRTALADLRTSSVKTYTAAVAALVESRQRLHDVRQVLAWLTQDNTRTWSPDPPGTLAGTDVKFPQVAAALAAEVDVTLPPSPAIPAVHLSLRDEVVALPDLASPAQLAKPYQAHHAAAVEYTALRHERRQVDAKRNAAQAADRRALADAIRSGSDDPGDAATRELEAQVADLDQRIADAHVRVRDTRAGLWALVAKHRDGWHSALLDVRTEALARYAPAVEDVIAQRPNLHEIDQTAAWIDKVTASQHVGGFLVPAPRPVAGVPWDTLADALRRDAQTQTG